MKSENEMALEALNDAAARENFIKTHERYILREAFKTAHHFVSKSDDEWSIALLAFNAAIDTFNEEKGQFLSYASIVIKSRLTDYHRLNRKYADNELSVEPETFDGDPEEDDPEAAQKLAIAKAAAVSDVNSVKEEIEALDSVLQKYGFSFMELTGVSPKKDKARHDCAKAVAAALSDREIVRKMQTTRLLPIAEIIKITGLPRKVLENHRKYIIAAIEIMNGEYPLIAEYMKYIREEMSP